MLNIEGSRMPRVLKSARARSGTRFTVALVVRYLPANRHFRLIGCAHVVLVRYRA